MVLAARAYGLPTTIARLSVPYGERGGGWPAFHLELMLAGHPIAVHEDGPSIYNPLHEDDIVEQVPRLLEIADVPATVVNWAGNDAVRVDTTRLHELVGPARVAWREGLRRMAETRHPRLFMD